ncbi:MAG: hypothetical protein WCI36_00875 [bacterium]
MKKEKFQMKRGQILLVEKLGGDYLILWQTDSCIQHWPHGDNKMILPVRDLSEVFHFLFMISRMFGVILKRHDVPEHLKYECIFEII